MSARHRRSRFSVAGLYPKMSDAIRRRIGEAHFNRTVEGRKLARRRRKLDALAAKGIRIRAKALDLHDIWSYSRDDSSY